MTSTQIHPGALPRMRGALLHALAENWWMFLLRGIVAVLFGIVAVASPGVAIIAVTLVWAAYAFVDGMLALWAALAGDGSISVRWWLAAAGAAGLFAGIFALAQPGAAALALLFFIAAWAIVVGLVQIMGAIRLRRDMDGEWLLALSGTASVVFGILVLMQPRASAAVIAWMLGVFAVVMGVAYVLFALRLRAHRDLNPALRQRA